ncbi:unnamed protein product (macronuclear) [Paramecium tetraurelia]|uniref:Uncharacterized protein n=1 Tax=Paramecium tetraurelia TaxID=5888 RepID=A0DCT0_PARTE|nr:uncharacterized protein GSPATT00015706001 [Paramecium tetraurelia]CAK80847.1 unnamed protein product [Paramecium tetraurelia]|eukprot:XP_001448244.1 hypothetical protein (macronuclear) [Paramecium tetraurelia strain d4-2]
MSQLIFINAQNRGERIFLNSIFKRFCKQFQFIAESFETAVGWKDVPSFCENEDCERISKNNVEKEPQVTLRISQVYDSGGFKGIDDPVKCYSGIEDAAREEQMKNVGSIYFSSWYLLKIINLLGMVKMRKQFKLKQIGDKGVRFQGELCYKLIQIICLGIRIQYENEISLFYMHKYIFKTNSQRI